MKDGIFFVTRLKSNADLETGQEYRFVTNAHC